MGDGGERLREAGIGRQCYVCYAMLACLLTGLKSGWDQLARTTGALRLNGWQRPLVALSHQTGPVVVFLLLLCFPSTMEVVKKGCLEFESEDATPKRGWGWGRVGRMEGERECLGIRRGREEEG